MRMLLLVGIVNVIEIQNQLNSADILNPVKKAARQERFKNRFYKCFLIFQ